MLQRRENGRGTGNTHEVWSNGRPVRVGLDYETGRKLSRALHRREMTRRRKQHGLA